MTPKPPMPPLPLTDEELKWVDPMVPFFDGNFTSRLLATISDLQRQLGEAKAAARTPVTTEVCEEITQDGTCHKGREEWVTCTQPRCPVRLGVVG